MQTAIQEVTEVDAHKLLERVQALRSENEQLLKRNQQLKQEAENIRIVVEQDSTRQLGDIREQKRRSDDERARFNAQRAEFEKRLEEFRTEKEGLQGERQAAADMKANYETLSLRASEFLRLVRAASAQL